MIRISILLIALLIGLACPGIAQDTPYGRCPGRAQVYQERYEQDSQARDLVCYQKALQRELSGKQTFNCPHSARCYQNAYEKYSRTNDLVYYQ